MSTRRRPRTQKRGRQPRTLRTRLVVSAVALIAVVCAVIGTVTTIALSRHLDHQKNAQVIVAGRRAAGLIGSQNAASYQLATGDPVMAIGGFNGSDPSPTLAQFQKYVAQGRIRYFIAGGFGGGGGNIGSDVGSQISSWVEKNFKKVTVGSATFYDLTQKSAG
ncbi:hypothetical protein GCM10022206_54400 [Streptomyces chiangmaiensis]